MKPSRNTFENFPDWILEKWQDIADLLAETIGIPTVLIMKSENESMEVFISSHSENNPYNVGSKEKWYGSYSETVIKTQNKLLVPNATKDKIWDKNPDIKLGMIAYLGFPLNFPANQPFGTLCVLDNKERHFTLQNEKLIRQFKNVIELDLALLRSFDLKTSQMSADVFREIADRKKVEESLRKSITGLKQSEQSLNLVQSSLEATSDALYWMTPDSTIVNVNEAACRLLGYTREELLQLRVPDVDVHYDEELWVSHFIELRKFGTLKFESKQRTKDGRLIPVEIVANYIRFGDEEYNCAFVRDITERKAVENSLRESEFELENAERMAKVGNWIVIATNPYAPEKLYWSKEMYHIVKRDPSSFTPTLAAQMDLFVPEDARKLAEAVANSMKTSVPYDIELQLKDEVGRDAKWIRSHSEMVYDEKGQINGMRGTAQDITERKQAEEKLRLKNFIFDVSIAAKSIADINGIITEANNSFIRVWGYPEKNEVIGKPISFFIKEPDAANTIITALNNHGEWTGDYIALKKDGSTFIAHGLATVVKDETGKIIAYQSAVIDITDSKLSENKLKVSEQLYRNLFDQANEGLILLTMDGKIAELNQSFARMHGYTVDEMKNMDIQDLDVLRENAFDGRAEVMQRIYHGEVVRFEVEHYHKKGHSFFLSDTVSLITIAGQQYFLAFHQDITERKEAEEKLQYSERTLRESQKIAGLGTFVLDIIAGIFRTSDILNEIFGIDEKYDHSVSGWAALIHPEDREMVVNHLMNEVIGNLQPGNIEFRFVRYNDKTTRWMHVLGKLEFDADGHPIIVHGTAQDITERKLAQNEIIKAKGKAEENDRLKTAFLLNMSHEIRTPMNGILGFSSLLSEPGLESEEQQEYIKLIQKAGARMLNIISEIMDISKIESGQMAVHFHETNINEKIENVYNLLKPDAETKRINLSFKNSLPDEQAFTVTDKDKLFVILTNLVKNAIKYTDKGSIEFGYDKEREILEFFVKDTGIGIPKNRQEAIFERFIQSDIADIQARQGAGLGLSIAKAYVEMLGGRIWVESEEGKGSIFYFTLPDKAESEHKIIVQNILPPVKFDNHINPVVSGLKILIVEDDKTSEKFISVIVKELTKEVIEARTGNEAVEIFRNNPDIDLILMDIRMPALNGYEATRQIRQFNKEVVIIAQTAFGLSGDREKAIEAGCNDYIAKPIVKTELQALIQKYFKK